MSNDKNNQSSTNKGMEYEPLLSAVSSRQERLEHWLKFKIEKAKEQGEEMFLGVPDNWYENGIHICKNGHLNGMYLKSEMKGAVCIQCYEPSHICPANISEEEVDFALNGS